MKERPSARFLRAGEMLAMHPGAIHSGPSGMFWLFGGGAVASERRGDVAIVHVREALEHHDDSWGSDSYESIVKRVGSAMSGQDAADAHKREHRWDDGYEEMSASPPSGVLLCIDSPGGVVSGLNETVAAIQKLRKESGVPLVAFLNEMAASAAYALACACDEIVCPPSAIVGSIGVISTIASQAAKNEKDGIDVRLITSGARKADGHPHGEITDAAEEAELCRVMKLAKAFWGLVSKSRGLPVATIEGFEAGIFLGTDAEKRDLVDDVMSLDDAVLALGAKTDLDNGTGAGSIRHNTAPTGPSGATEAGDMLKLTAEMKKLDAKIAAEKDPKKLMALQATLEAYKKVEKHVEHTKSEEDDDDDDEDEDDDKKKKKKDDDDEPEEKKSSKKPDEEKAAAAETDEDGDDGKKASAALSLLETATGRKGSAALGAATALFARLDRIEADHETMKATALKSERAALIKRAEKYVPKRLVATMTSMTSLRALVEEAEKGAPMVVTEEGELLRPKASEPGTEASLPKETIAMIEQAMAAMPEGVDRVKFRAELVKNHLKAHTERLGDALNGAGRL